MYTSRTLAALGHAGVPGRHAVQPEHLAILVLQFVGTVFSYGTLIQDFCDGASHTTLPDSTLRSDYPCSANRVQKALYIMIHAPQVLRDLVTIQHPDSWVSCVNLATLLRLPLVLLLPYSIYERLTVAILFFARIMPMAVHLVRWRNPPPSYAAVWFLVINPATELFTYSGNPCPNPLHEGTYGVVSVVGYWVLSQYLCRDVLLQMGAQPAMVVLRHALAVCLTTYLSLAWRRRARAGGAGGRGGGGGAAAGPMHNSSSSNSSHGCFSGVAAGDDKGKTEGAVSIPESPLDSNARELRPATAPYRPSQQLQTGTAPLSGSEPTAASAAPRTVSAPNGSSAPNSSVSPRLSPHSDVAHDSAATLPSSCPPDQPTLSANQAFLRNSSSIMPTYRSFLQFRTTHIKIPNAHPSDLPPDFQQRLQQLLARGGQEGAAGPTSQPGSAAPGPAPHPRLHTVYIREGCIELLLCTDDWGGAAPTRGESAEAAGSVGLLPAAHGAGDGGGDSTAHGDRPSTLGCWVAGPDSSFVPASLYDGTDSGTGPLWDLEGVRDALQLPGASSGEAHAPQEAPHSTPPLRVLSVSPRVLFHGALAGGVEGADSPTVHALSLAVEVLVDGSSAGAELEVNLLHQGRVLGANVASFAAAVRGAYGGQEEEQHGPEWAAQPEVAQESQSTGHTGRGGNRPRELGLDIPIPEGMGLEPGAAMVEFRCGGRPVCVLSVLLTQQQVVAEEVGTAARAWQQQQQQQEQGHPVAHGELASRAGAPGHGQLDALLVDLGTWECHVLSYTQQGGSPEEQQHAGSPLYRPSTAELAALGAHLLPYAESRGWCRTAGWIREGLDRLGDQQQQQQEEEEEEEVQAPGRGQNLSVGKEGGDATGAEVAAHTPPSSLGASQAAAPADSKELPSEAVAACIATVSVDCGGEGREGCGRGIRALNSKERPACAVAGPAGALGRWLDVTPASVVEQGYQVFETLCLILLVTTGGSGVSTTMLAMGPGALVLLSRAFLTHGSWARLLAAFRTPRYLCHIAYKVAATAGWALDRPELLWGLPEAVYDGMLLPLCCPLPPRLAVPLLVANAAALTAVLSATGPPPPGLLGAGLGSSSSPLPAALAGLRLVVLGLATLTMVHSRRGRGQGHGRAYGHGHDRQGMTGRRIAAARGLEAAAPSRARGVKPNAAPKESLGKLASAAAEGGNVTRATGKDKDV